MFIYMFAQILTPNERQDAWKVFLNIGIAGVVAFVGMLFGIAIGWIVVVAVKRALLKHFPDLINEAILTLQSVRKSQEGIAANQMQQGINTAKIIDLHASGQRRDEDTAKLIREGMDPIGLNFRHHVFSVRYVEEFLLLSLNLLQDYVDRAADPNIKIEWDRHIEEMRRSLDRPEMR